MSTDKIDIKARTYFLQQGQSIGKLYEILNTGFLIGWFKSSISLIFEGLFYLLGAAFILLAIMLPNALLEFVIQVNQDTELKISVFNEDIRTIILVAQITIGLLCIVPFTFAATLSRNRRKSALIRNAFEEVEIMKEGFDKAVKDLKL